MNIKQLNEKLAKFFEDQDQNEFDSEEYYVVTFTDGSIDNNFWCRDNELFYGKKHIADLYNAEDFREIADKIRTYVEVELGKEVDEIVDIEDDEDSIETVTEASIETVTDSANNYVDEFIALRDNHQHNGDKTMAEIIIPRIDEITVEQIKSIMEDYSLVGQDQSIFPSDWDTDLGAYPVKFAEALSKSKDAENETDIFNVFYCRRNLDAFKDAIEVWKKATIEDIQQHKCNTLDLAAREGIDSFIYDVFGELQKHYPEFVDKVSKEAKKYYNKDVLAIINDY